MNAATTVRTVAVSAAALAALALPATATAADLTTPAHHQTVAAVATDTATVRTAAAVQPATFQQTPQQAPASASTTGAITVGGAALVLLGAAVWYAIRKANHKPGYMAASFALGVFLAGGALGSMTQQLVTQGVTAIATLGGSFS